MYYGLQGPKESAAYGLIDSHNDNLRRESGELYRKDEVPPLTISLVSPVELSCKAELFLLKNY